MRRSPTATSTPLSEIPIDFPGGWPALLTGTPLAGEPTQSITLDQFLALYENSPTQALLDLTLEDISFFDGTSVADASPAAFLLGATPVESLHYGTQSWCERLSADTAGLTTCAGLNVLPTTTLIELDVSELASPVLAAHPDLRRVPLNNIAVFVNSPALDASLNELNLFATDIGQINVNSAITAMPAVSSVLISDIPVNDTNPNDGAYGRRDLVVDCSQAFDCTAPGATLGQAKLAGVLRAAAKLQDVGRAFFDRTVPGDPAILLDQIRTAIPAALDINDLIVGTLDQADFPWEDVDLTTAGLQDFARTGATLDWSLSVSISSARGGPGPFATTATVTLPPGFRYFTPTPARPAPAQLNTFVPAAGTFTGPTVTDSPAGQVLVWTIADLQADTDYTLSFRTTPGLELGQATASAKIQIANGAATTAGIVGVVDTGDASGDPASALPVLGNVLYLGYVDHADDVDLYGFSSTPSAQVGVRLSHLAGDGDLVVYGPATDTPANSPSPVATRTATPSAPPLTAEPLDVSGAGYTPEPDTDAGVPVIDGLTVVGRSAARNTDLEAVDAIAPDLLQVSSYNTSTSNLPYVLRVRQVDPPNTPACAAYARTGGALGTMPDLTALPADLSTVILVNQQRLGDTFGTTAANDVMTELATFAARPDVNGVVIPVDGDEAVRDAYAAWNANPCVTDRVNKVVNAITGLVVGIRNGALPGTVEHPSLANVVIVGGDDMVPMARLDDTTRVGNETGYADEFDIHGPYFGALGTSHFLSDDPYGDLDPIQWATRRLYVPELAIGRLVETPTQIIAQIDAFAAASGRLDAGSAYAAGYDFMTDGASMVRQTLNTSLASANGGPVNVFGPDNDSTWTGAELIGDITGPPSPSIVGVFGHADHTEYQAAGGQIVGATELADALPDGARLVLSMGCHSGLAVSDATVGVGAAASNDLASALTARGAAFVATTGYGYGDQVSVGLQERLMTLFAGQLDGAVSLGDALRNAKQQYFGSQGLYGAYDEKALSSTILYGLPMFAVGTVKPVRPTPPNVPTTPVNASLSSTHYDQHLSFTEKSSPIGRWFEASTGTGPQLPQITASRPVEPRAELDVTAAALDNSLLPAHGAVVTGLHTGQVVADFDAAFSRPTLDNAAGEPEPVNSVAAFPTRLAGVTTISDQQGLVGPDGIAQRQKLVLIPGQFISVTAGDPNGRGTQVLYDNMSGDVYYSASPDWTPPKVGEVVLQRTVGDAFANVAVSATDDSPPGIQRVVALYQAGANPWQSLDLGSSAGSFVGSLAVPAAIANEQIKVVIQVVDGAGNVSWAANKGPGFAPAPPPPPAPTVTLAPVTPASGWFATAPQITVAGSAGETFLVSIDGGPALTYLAPFSPGGLANGSHVIEVTGSNGGTASVTIKIDASPPQITAALSPPSNAAGWRKSAVTAAFTCTDSVSGIASCPPAQSTGLQQGAALVLSGTATDRAGLTTTISQTVKVDLTAPTTPVVSLNPASRAPDQTTTITATSTDTLSGVVSGEWWIGSDPGQGNGASLTLSGGSLGGVIPATLAGGSYDVSVRAMDLAGNWSAIGTAALTVIVPNVAPVATNQSPSTSEDTPLSVVLHATDSNPADVLSFVVVAQPAHGVLTGAAPNLTYTPAANFNGADSFTFRANDGTVDSNTATVSITVDPVNDAPVAAAVSVSTPRDVAVSVPLSATDVDGNALTFTIASQPANGTLTGSGASRTYTPNAGYAGPDSFTYTANDGTVDSNTAAVSITVEATNRPPTASPGSVSTAEDVAVPITLTGTDPDGNTLSFVVASAPTHGALTGLGANRTYTPAANFNGSDSFTFTVNDGSLVSAPATVTITVTPVNDAPVANPLTVSAVTAQPAAVVLSGSDVEGDALTFVILTTPAHGTLTGTGASRTYTSAAGFAGSDSFTYAVNDGQVQSPSATVAITVAAPPLLTLSVADDASRTTNARPLAGAVLSSGASAYIFAGIGQLVDVRQATFALDGAAFSTDKAAPFDFAGTNNTRACKACVLDAFPFESNLLALGTHHITVSVLLRNGSTAVLDASFSIANTTPHGIAVSASSTYSSPIPLDGATLAGRRFIFLAAADDAISGLNKVVFQLDGTTVGTDSAAPYDAVDIHGRTAPGLDTTRLANGSHRMVVTVQLSGGGQVVYTANFTVSN
jgi:hypothetical protein